MIAVNANSGITSLKDLIAKGKTGTLNFASAGSGTPQHIIGEMFNVKAGTKIVHVPYRGSGPAVNDLVGGQVPVTFENPVPILPFVKSGKVRILAVTSAKRSSVFPDIPTAEELGVVGFSAQPWYGLLGPAHLPDDITNRATQRADPRTAGEHRAQGPAVRARRRADGHVACRVQEVHRRRDGAVDGGREGVRRLGRLRAGRDDIRERLERRRPRSPSARVPATRTAVAGSAAASAGPAPLRICGRTPA